MFERFADEARRVVVQAQEEARSRGHAYVGTEHLLLGLIRDEGCRGVSVLKALGLAPATVRAAILAHLAPGAGSVGVGTLPFTPRAQRVIELSLREALQLELELVRSEHVLLALLEDGDGIAGQVLATEGADLDSARAFIAGMDPTSPIDGTGLDTESLRPAGGTEASIAGPASSESSRGEA